MDEFILHEPFHCNEKSPLQLTQRAAHTWGGGGVMKSVNMTSVVMRSCQVTELVFVRVEDELLFGKHWSLASDQTADIIVSHTS